MRKLGESRRSSLARPRPCTSIRVEFVAARGIQIWNSSARRAADTVHRDVFIGAPVRLGHREEVGVAAGPASGRRRTRRLGGLGPASGRSLPAAGPVALDGAGAPRRGPSPGGLASLARAAAVTPKPPCQRMRHGAKKRIGHPMFSMFSPSGLGRGSARARSASRRLPPTAGRLGGPPTDMSDYLYGPALLGPRLRDGGSGHRPPSPYDGQPGGDPDGLAASIARSARRTSRMGYENAPPLAPARAAAGSAVRSGGEGPDPGDAGGGADGAESQPARPRTPEPAAQA